MYIYDSRRVHRHDGARVHVPNLPLPGAVSGGMLHALPHSDERHDAARQASHRLLQQHRGYRQESHLHLAQTTLLQDFWMGQYTLF